MYCVMYVCTVSTVCTVCTLCTVYTVCTVCTVCTMYMYYVLLYVMYVLYVLCTVVYVLCVLCVLYVHVILPCCGVCCSEVIRCEDWMVVAVPNESFEHARFEQELSKYRELWKDNIRTYGRLYCPNYDVRTLLQCTVLIPCFLVNVIGMG